MPSLVVNRLQVLQFQKRPGSTIVTNPKLLSETVPPMNSDESRRSGGAYSHLGARQERTEALRTLT